MNSSTPASSHKTLGTAESGEGFSLSEKGRGGGTHYPICSLDDTFGVAKSGTSDDDGRRDRMCSGKDEGGGEKEDDGVGDEEREEEDEDEGEDEEGEGNGIDSGWEHICSQRSTHVFIAFDHLEGFRSFHV